MDWGTEVWPHQLGKSLSLWWGMRSQFCCGDIQDSDVGREQTSGVLGCFGTSVLRPSLGRTGLGLGKLILMDSMGGPVYLSLVQHKNR